MIRAFLLIFCLTVLLDSDAQNSNSLDDSDINFINSAIKDKRRGIFLVDRMTTYDLTQIKEYVGEDFFVRRIVDENKNGVLDTIKISKKDKEEIKKRLNTLKKFQWTLDKASKINFKDVALINFDSSVSKSFMYAIKYHIGPPIYFANKQYCIFSFSYTCGGLCGHGQIAIYKRAADGWKLWDSLIDWDE